MYERHEHMNQMSKSGNKISQLQNRIKSKKAKILSLNTKLKTFKDELSLNKSCYRGIRNKIGALNNTILQINLVKQKLEHRKLVKAWEAEVLEANLHFTPNGENNDSDRNLKIIACGIDERIFEENIQTKTKEINQIKDEKTNLEIQKASVKLKCTNLIKKVDEIGWSLEIENKNIISLSEELEETDKELEQSTRELNHLEQNSEEFGSYYVFRA